MSELKLRPPKRSASAKHGACGIGPRLMRELASLLHLDEGGGEAQAAVADGRFERADDLRIEASDRE